MTSSLIGKIEKALRYAEERDRAHFQTFTLTFRGEHDTYTVTHDGVTLACTCHFFPAWNACAHTMAVERMLEGMLPEGKPALQ